MTTEAVESDLILEVNDDLDNAIAAPPEDLSDEEIFNKSNKVVPYKKINENNSAGRLQMRVPDAPDNLIDLIYRKKCVECSAILTTISSALMHYNSVKHQNKIALKFLPHGTYNLPLSKEEIREIETGVSKTGEQNTPGVTAPKISKVPFRELIKKYDIKENIRRLDLEFCRVCEIPFSSKIAALQHYAGKKHKRVAENWATFNLNKNADTKEELRCDVCIMSLGSQMDMDAHLAGKRHHQKMKVYLDRLNSGSIAPSMSSRGFCDFNNVEREEANPVDTSKYIKEIILPKELNGSFIDSFKAEDTDSFRNSLPQPVYEFNRLSKPNFGTEYGMRLTNVGYITDYSMTRSFSGGMEKSYVEEYQMIPKSDLRVSYDRDIHNTYDFKPMEYDYYSSEYQSYHEVLSRPQMNAPYSPSIANKLLSKIPVSNFGPTKFKYSRKQQHL